MIPGLMDGASYSTTDRGLLCAHCKHGQVLEAVGGHTVIRCHYSRNSEGAVASTIQLMVTKCSRFESEELMKIWDGDEKIKIEDGHCWVYQYVNNSMGHEWVRADTIHDDYQVVLGYSGTHPNRVEFMRLKQEERETERRGDVRPSLPRRVYHWFAGGGTW